MGGVTTELDGLAVALVALDELVLLLLRVQLILRKIVVVDFRDVLALAR